MKSALVSWFLCLSVMPFVSGIVFAQVNDGVEYVERERWSVLAPDTELLKRKLRGPVRFITIHHTEGGPKDAAGEVEYLRAIQREHQTGKRKWGDIAYHYLIGRDGAIYIGRSEEYASASGTVYLTPEQWNAAAQTDDGTTTASKPEMVNAPGSSEGHITICFIGNYGTELPTEAARTAMARFVALKLRDNGLALSSVMFHREIACWSDCPGQKLYDWFRGPLRKRTELGEGMKAIERELAAPDKP